MTSGPSPAWSTAPMYLNPPGPTGRPAWSRWCRWPRSRWPRPGIAGWTARWWRWTGGSGTHASVEAEEPMVPDRTTPTPVLVVPMATHWVDEGQTTWVSVAPAVFRPVPVMVYELRVGEAPVDPWRTTAPVDPYPTPMHAVDPTVQATEVNRVRATPLGRAGLDQVDPEAQLTWAVPAEFSPLAMQVIWFAPGQVTPSSTDVEDA